MALALSNQMRQYAFMPEFTPRVDDYWTIDWFARMIKPDENPDLRIGANTVRGTV